MATTLPETTISVSREDATVEKICFENAWQVTGDIRKAGQLSGYVEATLEANRSLAAAGLVLPLGTVLTLPEWRISEERTSVRLWD
ncbi:tail protein X [Breoghania sp. JC706]|uniref:tail protein X n=1 Tax=Breoghania sp. JC706 TaxID=3117732 RepID=UPI00300AE046